MVRILGRLLEPVAGLVLVAIGLAVVLSAMQTARDVGDAVRLVTGLALLAGTAWVLMVWVLPAVLAGGRP